MSTNNLPLEFPEISPLETLSDYSSLTSDELSIRQANVTNYLVTFAINYSRRVKTSTDYLLKEVNEYKSVGNYQYDNNAEKTKEIQLARKLIEADELCGTVLDRMVSFSITPGNIENVKDKTLLAMLNKWKEGIGNLESESKNKTSVMVAKPMGLGVVFEQVLERLFVDGDAFVSEVWADDVMLDGKEYRVPYRMNIHDTLLVEYDDKAFVEYGQEKAFVSLTLAATNSLSRGTNRPIPLFNENGKPFTTHLKLRPKSFSIWGTSYFKRAFHPVAGKKRIEALEVNTIEGLINRLTILKAGKIDAEVESGIIAPHRLAILERLISQPKVNNMLLWPGDDISVLDIGPDAGLLTYESKYSEANEQILAALGFPRVLVDGEKSTTENWHKFLGVIAYLDKVRHSYIIPWINSVLRKIAVENGYEDEYPRFSFSRLKLHDLQQMLNAVKVYYDRGLMSELSAVTSADMDYELEKARREVEMDDGLLTNYGGPKDLPFSKNTEDGSEKDGNTSPEKDVEGPVKEEKAAASIKDADREALIGVFEDYLFALHDLYSKKIVEAVKLGYYDTIDFIVNTYGAHLKRSTKEQMKTLFNQEVYGYRLDNDFLVAAIDWIDTFYDGYLEDMSVELTNVIANNKERRAVLPDLIAGIMGAIKTKRLRLYSSSVYNKAKSAGELTQQRATGVNKMQWKSALSERTCEWCGEMHNKVLTLDGFFAKFPPHPDCECWGEATKEELSVGTPEKDRNDWGKVSK